MVRILIFGRICGMEDLGFEQRFHSALCAGSEEDCRCASKMSQETLTWSFHRAPRSGVEQDSGWYLTLDGSGESRLLRLRMVFDDISFSESVYSNSMDKSGAPKKFSKVNIHAWKVRMDCLPTRLNISRRGIDIPSILCPVCGSVTESSSHLFFDCLVAKDNFRKICRWWEVDFMEVHTFDEWVSWIDVDNFNSFIDNSSLIDLPLGGHLFTWMNKAGTKLSKLDRFLISEEVVEALHDVRVIAIDLLWSNHNPILLHVSKSDFGPTPFKLFHSWLLRDSFDKVFKMKLPKLEEHKFGRKLLSHEKFASSKLELSLCILNTKRLLISVHLIMLNWPSLSKSIKRKNEAGFANDADLDSRISWLQACLSSSWASIPINGSPTSEFSIKRGLRKGDLISPFLFILVMEGFHKALIVASDLKFNIQKSNIYGIGVSNVDVSSMASNSGCASGSFPFTYLSQFSPWKLVVQFLLGTIDSSVVKAFE
ncbi:RNA-directed DNA polymerase, eukaryota, reverse transcriptase zinc-binding domain protein [Tanacetum coccineum]